MVVKLDIEKQADGIMIKKFDWYAVWIYYFGASSLCKNLRNTSVENSLHTAP